MQIVGKVTKHNLEGGHWTLTEEGTGKTYQLQGLGQEIFVEGEELAFKGEVSNEMTLGMTGPVFNYESYSDMVET